ncbi:unnamed protein product [Caretta caretta]
MMLCIWKVSSTNPRIPNRARVRDHTGKEMDPMGEGTTGPKQEEEGAKDILEPLLGLISHLGMASGATVSAMSSPKEYESSDSIGRATDTSCLVMPQLTDITDSVGLSLVTTSSKSISNSRFVYIQAVEDSISNP